MPVVSMKDLLEAGVHFGHQTRRWNPKMKRFIFTERGGIYIIDLQQTQQLLDEAHAFARAIAERGGTVLFVGTKKQAQDSVATEAARVGMPYVNHRWLGGLLTNWRTISDRIQRLHELRALSQESQLDLLPAKERIAMTAELEKLEANLGGVAEMRRQPDAVFIIDLRKEQLAVREARRLGLPVIALVDTNCDPDEAEYVIPGNDDAIRSCSLIVKAIAAGIEAGRQRVASDEMAAPRNGRAAAAEEAPIAQAPAEEAPAEQPPPAEAAAAVPAAEPAVEAPAEQPSSIEAAAVVPAAEPAVEAPAEEPAAAEAPAAEPPVEPAPEIEPEPAAEEAPVTESEAASAPQPAKAAADEEEPA
jgi:small subunit ribosomal protein S2